MSGSDIHWLPVGRTSSGCSEIGVRGVAAHAGTTERNVLKKSAGTMCFLREGLQDNCGAAGFKMFRSLETKLGIAIPADQHTRANSPAACHRHRVWEKDDLQVIGITRGIRRVRTCAKTN